ncbi:MAG: type II secretion system protein GspJ [Limisphaerales bacterium]
MNCRSQTPWSSTRRAFTLVEVLIATLIFAIVMLAMTTAFYGALHLESKTARMTEDTIPLNHAVSIIKADLRGTLVPGGTLAGPITGLAQGFGNSQIQLFTTTGVIDIQQTVGAVQPQALTTMQPQPWGDIQLVSYYLRTPWDQTRGAGQDLVRAVTRNLLATGQPDLWEQPLMTGVRSLDIFYYDGMNWLTTWDTNTQQLLPPLAIKFDVQFADQDVNQSTKLPIEIVVPLLMQPGTNTTSSGGTAGTSSGGSGGGASTGGRT